MPSPAKSYPHVGVSMSPALQAVKLFKSRTDGEDSVDYNHL